MEKKRGTLERVKYQSEDGSHTISIFRDDDGEEFVAFGPISMINIGESVELLGENVVHPVHGKQFKVKNFTFVDPESLELIKKYLASGLIKGVGTVTARR
jgi:exodeoxyribonuclease V alpha subunit